MSIFSSFHFEKCRINIEFLHPTLARLEARIQIQNYCRSNLLMSVLFFKISWHRSTPDIPEHWFITYLYINMLILYRQQTSSFYAHCYSSTQTFCALLWDQYSRNECRFELHNSIWSHQLPSYDWGVIPLFYIFFEAVLFLNERRAISLCNISNFQTIAL